LSNVGKISSKAREEILQAAQKLNYPTSRIAGYEIRKKHLNIALITDFHEGRILRFLLLWGGPCSRNRKGSTVTFECS
jgi:DNA-binding LacI/PurR family transcriptional regulator